MKATSIAVTVLVLAAVVGLATFAPAGETVAVRKAPKAAPAPKSLGERVSAARVHKNLAIFLIHGTDKIVGKEFMTLEEALASKKVVIAETGSVNNLTIQNNSTVTVFIQSGDIVKGGKQDRVMRDDVIVPPNSKKLPLAVFCVEQGRWQRRGNEAVGLFSQSGKSLGTRQLKLAAKLNNDQGEVWKEVAKAQDKLSASAGEQVNAAASASSLELALDNKKLKALTADYVKHLAGIIDKDKDVIGFAIAVNGKISSVDMYASGALFRKLWPKQLDAAATEAVAEFKKGKTFETLTADDVKAFSAEARKAGKQSTRNVAGGGRVAIRDGKRQAAFDTYDADAAAPIHQSILAK